MWHKTFRLSSLEHFELTPVHGAQKANDVRLSTMAFSATLNPTIYLGKSRLAAYNMYCNVVCVTIDGVWIGE
jgi:hypothetical protein